MNPSVARRESTTLALRDKLRHAFAKKRELEAIIERDHQQLDFWKRRSRYVLARDQETLACSALEKIEAIKETIASNRRVVSQWVDKIREIQEQLHTFEHAESSPFRSSDCIVEQRGRAPKATTTQDSGDERPLKQLGNEFRKLTPPPFVAGW